MKDKETSFLSTQLIEFLKTKTKFPTMYQFPNLFAVANTQPDILLLVLYAIRHHFM